MVPHLSRLLPSPPQTPCRRQPLLPRCRASSLISLLRPFSKLPSSQHLRLGFVTYGPQDCDGSPVFVNRFFALGALGELKNDPSNLEMGRTVTGGSLGMAALEGYAAAIEVLVFRSIRTYCVLNNVRCLMSSRAASIRSLCGP